TPTFLTSLPFLVADGFIDHNVSPSWLVDCSMPADNKFGFCVLGKVIVLIKCPKIRKPCFPEKMEYMAFALLGGYHFELLKSIVYDTLPTIRRH
ncbi:MAG: hypothetical protein RL755_2027, partial [Pseudomonadota bacterium]